MVNEVRRKWRHVHPKQHNRGMMTDFAAARANMVESQIRPNKVTDPALIDAMATLPREQFVPGNQRPLAYIDEDLDIGARRHIMEPMVLARLVQAASPLRDDIALVVGCATGYSVAVLSRLCQTVIGLEADLDLVERASTTLVNLGIDNALIVNGALHEGHPKQAPYNVILFDGAVAEFPEAMKLQLADGGRIAGVIRRGRGVGSATVVTNIGGVFSERPIFDANIPQLEGFEPAEAFSF